MSRMHWKSRFPPVRNRPRSYAYGIVKDLGRPQKYWHTHAQNHFIPMVEKTAREKFSKLIDDAKG